MVVTLIFAFLLAIVAAIFALQNPTPVAANFFGVRVDGSLALFVLLGIAFGFLIGVLVMLPGRIKSGLTNLRQRKQIEELKASLEQHKEKLAQAQAEAQAAKQAASSIPSAQPALSNQEPTPPAPAQPL